MSLDDLLKDIRACTYCDLPHEPRPVLMASSTARLCIAGQAPGTRVHASGKPFTDPSGDRLRDWLGVTEEEFYDTTNFAIVPMGFCFPGLDAKGGDLPPRKECAPKWRQQVFDGMGNLELTLLVGAYAQTWHLGKERPRTLTATVEKWRDYAPDFLPLPHPSWRNNVWLKKNPWFEAEVVPYLQERVRGILEP